MIKQLWTWLAEHSSWWLKWMGEGTDDDRRNFGWRIGEALRVQILWAWTIIDIRIGVWRSGTFWPVYTRLPYKTEQNFWNGFLTFQIYLVAWRWFIWPKLHIVFRPCRAYYLLIGTPGLLFDRGEIHAKFSIHP